MMWWIPGDYRGDTRCNGLLIKPGQQDTWDEHDLPRGSPGGRRDVTELVRREAAEFVAASFPSLAAWIRSDGSAEGGVNLGGSEVTIAFRPSSRSELLPASSVRPRWPSCVPWKPCWTPIVTPTRTRRHLSSSALTRMPHWDRWSVTWPRSRPTRGQTSAGRFSSAQAEAEISPLSWSRRTAACDTTKGGPTSWERRPSACPWGSGGGRRSAHQILTWSISQRWRRGWSETLFRESMRDWLLSLLIDLERSEWEQTNCIGQRDAGGRAAPPGVPATTWLMDVDGRVGRRRGPRRRNRGLHRVTWLNHQWAPIPGGSPALQVPDRSYRHPDGFAISWTTQRTPSSQPALAALRESSTAQISLGASIQISLGASMWSATCGDGSSVNSQPDLSCSPAMGAVPLRRRQQRGHRHRRQGGCSAPAGARPSRCQDMRGRQRGLWPWATAPHSALNTHQLHAGHWSGSGHNNITAGSEIIPPRNASSAQTIAALRAGVSRVVRRKAPSVPSFFGSRP